MIFGTNKLHNAENEMMLSLCHYVNSYIYIETVHSFLHSLVTKIL